MGKIVTICASNNSMHNLYELENIILESGYTPLIPAADRGGFIKYEYALEAQKDKVKVANMIIAIPGKDGTYDEITQESINYAKMLGVQIIDNRQLENRMIDAIKMGCNKVGMVFSIDSLGRPFVKNKLGRTHGAGTTTIQELYKIVNTLYVELKLNLFGENDEQEK